MRLLMEGGLGDIGDDADSVKRKRLRAFLNHLIAYFGVMVVLVPVNAVLAPRTPWFLFPLVAWGAPLAVHAAYVMGWWGRGKREAGHGRE